MSILTDISPNSLHYYAISTADEDYTIRLENVCIALNWCLKEPPDYLCMSIGSEKWLETREIGELTKQLAEAGTKIFSACANNGHIAFPAAYPWVTGVRYVPGLPGIFKEISSPIGSDIAVGEFTTPVLEKLAVENHFFNSRSNSMAAPYVLGKLLAGSGTIEGVPVFPVKKKPAKNCGFPMPVVALNGPLERMKLLLAHLQNEGFQAALLTDRQETEWLEMVMHVIPENVFDWAEPLGDAGILLLDAEDSLASLKYISDYSLDLNGTDHTCAYKKILLFFDYESEADT